jgi:CheY-like chemotaxis protein
MGFWLKIKRRKRDNVYIDPKRFQYTIIEGRMASVLIVEDNRETLRLFQKSMMKIGNHHVSTATSLKEAHALLAEDAFHLIVLDLEMPEGTGLDLYQHHADRLNAHNTIVVAVSAEANYQPACREAGIEHFFLKPLMPSSLANIVSELVNTARSSRY